MKTPATVSPRQRRFFLVLPLLVLPFLAMAFWALGGGGAAPLPAGPATGLNLQLPAPRLEATRQQDKLSLYEELGRRLRANGPDKRNLLEAGARDVLLPWSGDTAAGHLPEAGLSPAGMAAPFPGTRPTTPAALHEAGITERLTRLTALVNGNPSPARAEKQATPPPGDGALRQDIDRLERLMEDMNGESVPPDPEVQQLEGMLDRILDIQHPGRVQARLKQQSRENSRQLFPLQPLPAGPPVTLLGETPDSTLREPGFPPAPPGQAAIRDAFHGPGDSQLQAATPGNYLAAVIREKQKVTTGSTVHLYLLQEAYLGGHLLAAGTRLHGTCRVQGERLFITVSAVPAGNALLPVALSAHDLDGMEGLYVPGAITQQAAGRGAGQVLGQGLPLPPLTPSLGAQAASAGIETARNLFRRKARLVKVTLPPGHRLYLLDQQASH